MKLKLSPANSHLLDMFRITTFVFVGLLFVLITNATKVPSSEAFKRWKTENNKTYSEKSSKTESAAQRTFEKNKAAIEKHNKDPEVTYTQKINSHADLTPEEFKKYRTGDNVPQNEDKKKGAKDMRRYKSENNKRIDNEGSNKKSTKSESTTSSQSTKSNNMKNENDSKSTTTGYTDKTTTSTVNKTSKSSENSATKCNDIKSTPTSKSKSSTSEGTKKTTGKTSPGNNTKSSTAKGTKTSTSGSSKTSPGNSNKSSTAKGTKTTTSAPSKTSSDNNKSSTREDNQTTTSTSSNDSKRNYTSNNDPNGKLQNQKPSGKSQARSFEKTKADKGEYGRMDVPTSLDFSTIMPPVKDQGMCGCCWAFAAVALLEYWSAKTQNNKRFSEQNLVECSTTNCYGCNGGSTLDALAYVMDNGIAESSEYPPYKQANGTCQKDEYLPTYFLPNMGYAYVDGDEDFLKELMIKFGPMAVSMDALAPGFVAYSNGVFQSLACSNETNHAVLAVGFGTDPNGEDYWLIRNSWGTSWGMNGYGKIARNRGNMCGIATRARVLLN